MYFREFKCFSFSFNYLSFSVNFLATGGSSIIDGLGMGLGFAFALTLLGGVRELLGSGALFGFKLIPGDLMLVFVLAPGAFIVLGYLIALINKLKKA